MKKKPKIVNEKMADKDGFTALHIAASNDFVEIANVLINIVSKMFHLCINFFRRIELKVWFFLKTDMTGQRINTSTLNTSTCK